MLCQRLFTAIALVLVFLSSSRAQNTPNSDPAAESKTSDLTRFAETLGLSRHLRISPKVLSSTDGENNTVGLEYKYSRQIQSPTEAWELDFYLESQGLVVAEKEQSPTTRLEHRVRLNLIGLGYGTRREDYQKARDPHSGDVYRKLRPDLVLYPDPELRQVRALYREYAVASDNEKRAIFTAAKALWDANYDKPLTVDTNGVWPELEQYEEDKVKQYKEFTAAVSLPWVSFELSGGAESDQTFDDIQYVGGGRLYGKWQTLGLPIDYALQLVRGYKTPRDHLNFQGGPYLWTAVDFVDATSNEARQAVTAGVSDQFARLNVGVFYRNELLSLNTNDQPDKNNTVALEFAWNYYLEFDAPESIKQADLDQTSFFRVTALFPYGMFLEYTDGKQPLDLRNTSTLYVGFRFGM